MGVYWEDHLDAFGRELVEFLGHDAEDLPRDHNLVTRALEDPEFVGQIEAMAGFSRNAMARVATVCQMVVFDAEGGPEGDRKPKALRRHWYSWFKTRFAQPLAIALGDYEVNAQGVIEIQDLAWTGRLSKTYAGFVDRGEITYRDMWVEDASRMMERQWATLFTGCHVIVAVEKDSLFGDFVTPARALGARAVYSGKGKSSKAAIEKCLRDHFGWEPVFEVFTEDEPLVILHVSDYDFDGEAVIGPTFAQQARRYTGHILEARVGIQPDHVEGAGKQMDAVWYRVKVSNRGYQRWAVEKALFLAECGQCSHKWPVVGIAPYGHWRWCPMCGGLAERLEIEEATPHGLEVEALTTRDYRALLVHALLQVLPFDWIVRRLREECQADPYDAATQVGEDVYDQNESYQVLMREFERLEGIKVEFENRVRGRLERLGAPHVSDWEMEGEDPAPGEFVAHVREANDWVEPWRPFDRRDRTRRLADWLRENQADVIGRLSREVIEW